MKIPILSLFLLSLSTAHCYSPVAIPFDIHRGSSTNDMQYAAIPSLQKRSSSSLQATLSNQQSFYMANISVGTPGQNIGVLIDTGSSDLWVMDALNPYCVSSSSSSASVNVENRLKLLNHTNKHHFQIIKRNLANNNNNNNNNNPPPSSTTIIDDSTIVTPSPTIVQKNIISQIESWFTEIGTVIATTTTIGSGSGSGSGSTQSQTQSIDTSTALATMDCSSYGTFDQSNSSTFNSNNTDFLIKYGDDTFASGTWVYDSLSLGNVSVTDFSFALANETNSTMGVFGVGLAGLETTYSNANSVSSSYTYLNFPMKLVAEGIIPRNVYSLYLNDLAAEDGAILFGAIDHSKYSGTLTTVAVVNTLKSQGYSQPVKFEITLSSITSSSSSNTVTVSNSSIPALLDSGTTLTYLPVTFINNIATAIGATYSKSSGYYTASCSIALNYNITFDFTGASIVVPLSNFLSSTDGVQLVDSSGNIISSSKSSTCVLALMDAGDNSAVLGDSFLSAAYVVYDLDNYQVSLAQAVYDVSSSDIELVSSDSTSAIPLAVLAASYSATYSGSVTKETGTIGSGGSSGTKNSGNRMSISMGMIGMVIGCLTFSFY